jgi:arylsulfatase A-like enzyme
MQKLTLALSLLLCSSMVSAYRAPGDTRPNIVFYHPDTVRASSLGTYGHPFSATPAFDAVARQGVLFEDAHVQHTQCAPSRCAMLTGRYMHVLGHRTQTHLVRPYEENFLADLKASGYTNIMLGKNDVFAQASFSSSLTYWEDITGVAEGPNPFKFGEAGYYSFAASAENCKKDNEKCNQDLKAVSLAVGFISQDPPEPFFVYIPGIGAHPPYGNNMLERASFCHPIRLLLIASPSPPQ